MILLDSDHLTVLKYTDSPRFARLNSRLISAPPLIVGTTIVNVEEQMRGWLAAIAKERFVERQVSTYRELNDLFEFFGRFNIASFNEASSQLFLVFRKAGVKIGTMDLKTASIAIASNALQLTANRRDFEKVPGLKFENWLD